jgi:hypothetical protein
VDLSIPSKLDIAIDLLSELGSELVDYAMRFLTKDIHRWNQLYSDRAYEPNDDYWYILIRSVARTSVDESKQLNFLSLCENNATRGVLEGIVEALGDMETANSRTMLQGYCTNSDPFIAELAADILE